MLRFRKSHSPEAGTVYFSICAQPTNLGDIEIRDVALEWLAESGCTVRLLTDSMPQSYIDAFHLPADAELFSSSVAFQLAFARDVLRRRAHLVFAPGPHVFSRSRAGSRVPRLRSAVGVMAKSVINLANTAAVRGSGGKVLTLGRAVRGDMSRALAVERLRARLCALYLVRDSASAESLNLDVRRIPDLAFYRTAPLPPEGDKDVVVFSFRGDHTTNDQAVGEAMHLVRHRGLRPVLVTQVQRDEPGHALLAATYGCEHLAWGDRTHGEQLERVKGMYAQSRMVVSDRLHALIFGVQFGAIPVMVIHEGNDKLPSTLEHIVRSFRVDATAASWGDIGPLLDEGPDAAAIWNEARQAQSVLGGVRGEVATQLGARKQTGLSTSGQGKVS